MTIENKSAFTYKGNRVLSSSMQITGDETEDQYDYNLVMKPRVDIDHENNILKVVLLVQLKGSNLNIEVSMEGTFGFNNIPEEQQEGLFYTNAPAILFPYIRAYIATMTALSGIQTVHIPSLNFTKFHDEFKENTNRM